MNYTEFRTAVFAAAQEMGLKEYELYYSAGSSVSVGVYKHELSGFQSSTDQGVCFRCLLDGQMGYASTSLFSADEAVRLVAHAAANARTIEKEEQEFLYAGDEVYTAIEPKAITEPSTDELIAFAMQLQQALYDGDSRITDGTMSAVEYESTVTAIDNSYGLSLREETKLTAAFAETMLVDGEPYTAYENEIGNLAEMEPAKLAGKAIEKTASQVGAQGGPTGSMRVILAPGAVRSLLSVFSAVFSAENAQQGLSLLADKLGSAIAADCVTLMDDPFYADSYVKASFDAEGCATRTKAVIEAGTLRTLLHNLKTAHAAGVTTTANASKAGYASPVGIRPYTFYLQPGSRSQDELMAELGEGVMITSLSGLHAGANAITGDFSLQSNGFLITEGKKGKAVRNFTVAGNFYELLKSIEEVGSDLELGTPSGHTTFGSPSLLVKQLSLAGQA